MFISKHTGVLHNILVTWFEYRHQGFIHSIGGFKKPIYRYTLLYRYTIYRYTKTIGVPMRKKRYFLIELYFCFSLIV